MKKIFLLATLLAAAAQVFGEEPTPAQQEYLRKVAEQAKARTLDSVVYDPTYLVIPYPNGDVPADRGVCTDEIVRVYRKLGTDLQKEVHEDMKANFRLYPKTWGLSRTDTNIDHRRVPNLRVFFKRKGLEIPVTDRPADYKPGDLVTWQLSSGVPHIGMVVAEKSADGERHLIVHNIGAGPQMEDVLFAYTLTGHYRYFGKGK